MDDVDVVVVGAGPTGLAMAIELARASVSHRIVDKSVSPARHSQALVVQPRTLEQFDRYGIGQRFGEVGRRLDGVAIYDRRRRIAALPFDDLASRHPYLLLIAQSETERLLGEHLRSLGTEVERGTELVAVREGADAVELELRDREVGTERVSARWLVGCDGVHSTVRSAIDMPFVGDEVGQLFQLGDVELRGPRRPRDELRVHLRRGELVFIGPLHGDVYRLIVVNYPRDAATSDRTFGLDDFQAALRRCVSDELEAVSASGPAASTFTSAGPSATGAGTCSSPVTHVTSIRRSSGRA
jgi:3-(3-hydroxy-phenyl)propionate hydroxylase